MSQWALRKFDEEVGHARILEEPIFSLFAVLVHGLPDKLEVNLGSLNHTLNVSLLVMMTQNDGEYTRGELKEKI